MAAACAEAEASDKPTRRFRDFTWSTRDSWSCERRVIGEAEWTQGEANPRFVGTSLKPSEVGGQQLYEATSAQEREGPQCGSIFLCLI